MLLLTYNNNILYIGVRLCRPVHSILSINSTKCYILLKKWTLQLILRLVTYTDKGSIFIQVGRGQ